MQLVFNFNENSRKSLYILWSIRDTNTDTKYQTQTPDTRLIDHMLVTDTDIRHDTEKQ
jgi:hypothetical protein